VEIEKLSEIELLNENTMEYLFKKSNGHDEIFFKIKDRAKELKIANIFNKQYKEYKKNLAKGRVEKNNFCQFEEWDEHGTYEAICTGSWISNINGIFKQVPNMETGEVDKVEASRMMIVPTETLLNIDTNEEKVILHFHKYEKWNKITCDKTTVSVAHKIVELSKMGIDITSTNAKNMVDYFYDCLTLNDDPAIKFNKSLSRMGWCENEFMPYSKTIKFDGDSNSKYLHQCLTSSGNKEKWINYVGELRKNSELLRLQMAVSLASPLLEKLNLLPFILHMYGKTGTGKTVGMIAAMSIWGNPTMGKLTKSMNNTVNSVMDTCAFMRNIPVALDELQAIKSKMGYDKFVMLLCEGVERGRMKFDESKETRTWKNAFLFTGEEPVTGDNSGGGVFNRVIEVDVTGKNVIDVTRGEEIVAFLTENYGLIANEYIENVAGDMEEIKAKYNQINNNLKKFVNDTTTKQAMAMTCIILGDWLARKYFFEGEDNLNNELIKECMFTDSEVDITERAYEYIKDTISMNINKFQKENTEIWGKITEGSIYMQKTKLMELLKNAGYEFKAMQKTWSDKCYISKDSQGRYYHNTKCHGIKSNYVVFTKEFEEL